MRTTVRQLAEWVSGELVGDGDVPIDAARPLSDAGPGDITFVEGEKNLTAWHTCRASAAVVPPSVPLNGRPLIRVADPLTAFASIVLQLNGLRTADPAGRIDPTTHVHPTAQIGPDCSLGPFAVIGEGATLGARCRVHAGAFVGRDCRLGDDVVLYPHAVVYDDCVLGDRVIVHANAVVGADGFGYRTQDGRHVKVPQLGRVELGDDVEVGACTTIDRGTFGPTRIGDGTKIDNLVMIAHNCRIGPHNLLVSQVGIAGSCTTGAYVVMAGQVGVADHLTIGDKAVIGAQAGVVKDVPANTHMLGAPARPKKETWRYILSTERLPDLIKDVRRIKQALGLGEGQ
ncbi:MAG TPA: UDP-3-O-(3-hydroxymyristoyl)glucosamine N-acyltransferase [Fimbriiglobus sp.]|nr:UDP-3-O-(3-hydroxymyristoyl)glucosamine N-acyltransferase [Fimbriiglobus sp.]